MPATRWKAPLGETVDVVLETSHHSDGTSHRDLLREHIDLPVLLSHFCEFEDLLLNDGCAGAAVIANAAPAEVQFDEHKLLVVYARDPGPFEGIFRRHGVSRCDGLRLITEGEHLHSSDPRHLEAFEQLCCRLGVAEPFLEFRQPFEQRAARGDVLDPANVLLNDVGCEV